MLMWATRSSCRTLPTIIFSARIDGMLAAREEHRRWCALRVLVSGVVARQDRSLTAAARLACRTRMGTRCYYSRNPVDLPFAGWRQGICIGPAQTDNSLCSLLRVNLHRYTGVANGLAHSDS